MSYRHVIKMFEERKEKLSDIVQYGELDGDHKTRLEGAIDEIDFLLTTLRNEMRVSDGVASSEEAILPLLKEELRQEIKQLEIEKEIIGMQGEMQEQRRLREG